MTMELTRTAVVTAALLIAGVPTLSSSIGQAATAADGRIAYNSYGSGDGDIYLVNADGTGRVNVTADQPRGEVDDDQGPDWSPDGSQIAFTRYRFQEGSDVFVINPDGTGLHAVTEETGTFEQPVFNSQPDWSPDGSQFAMASDRDGNLEIWTIDVDGTDPEQLTATSGAVRNIQPTWTPDASRLAFISDRDGGQDVFTMNAEGSNVVNVTNNANTNVNHWDPAWSPDGSRIAFTKTVRTTTPDGEETETDIWLVDADGSNAINLTQSPALEFDPVFSPDGSELSFTRQDANGDTDVWVMPIPAADLAAARSTTASLTADSSATQLTSTGTAGEPDWSASVQPVLKCQGHVADNPPATGEVVGTPGDDVLVGSDGRNTFSGRGGSDTICGFGGRDEVYGGDGGDLLYGGRQADQMFGGNGVDTCVGGPGSDAAHRCEYRSSIP